MYNDLKSTTMQVNRIITLMALTALMSMSAQAQSEGGLFLEAAAEKKINKQLNVSLETDFRTRNNFKTVDRWSVGLTADYKLTKWLKATAGYKLLNTNFREHITMNTSVLYNNWRPSYWGTRHRFYASLMGSYKFSNNLKLSLRERWQYTYRPEKTVERWDFDNAHWEDKVRSGKGKHQLRSRLQVSYDKKRGTVEPYASIELYNSWSIEKIRYTIGADWKLSKQHILGAYYLFQKRHNADTEMDDDEPDMHWLGIAYKFKF